MSIQHADADQIHKFAFISSSDPGAVGPNKAWVRTVTSPARILIRNPINTQWLDLFLSSDKWDTVDEIASLTPSEEDVLQYVSGSWVSTTIDDLKISLDLDSVPNIDGTVRANHTGTQLASTISDFNSSVDTRVAAAIAAEGFGELAYQNKATADITGGTVVTSEAGLGIQSPGTDKLYLKINEVLSSGDRILSFIVDDANRTINLAGDLIVGAAGATVSNINTGNETQQSIGDLLTTASEKTTPIDADVIGLGDSTSLNVIKYLTWANVKKDVRGVEVYTESSASTTMPVTRLGKLVRYTASGALDVTIPGTGTLGTNFAVELYNDGDNDLTIIADSGVTLIGNLTLGVGSICTIKAITTNTYKVYGETI